MFSFDSTRLSKPLGIFVNWAVLTAVAVASSGCTYISRDGPAGYEVQVNAEVTLPDPGYRLSYAFVTLTPSTIELFAAVPQKFASFSRGVALAGPREVRIGPGDSLAIAIFEAAGGGLFQPEAGRAGSATIPQQQVDRLGNIVVPYAGTIRALGRTPAEVQRDIEEGLKGRAIEPQAIVTVTDRRASDITVLGEVSAATRFPADPSGTKLLTALARAGGPRNPAFETIVTVQRRGRTEQALLSAVVSDPRQDITLAAGDVVFVSRQPRSFLVFGATESNAVGLVGSNNRRFIFEEENLTVADGVAKAGGLIDERADARGVFIYRMVPRSVLQRAGVDVSRISDPIVPTIFQVDLSKAEGYFIANSFFLQSRDIIYVSTAPANELSKIIALITSVPTGVGNVASSVTAVRAATQR